VRPRKTGAFMALKSRRTYHNPTQPVLTGRPSRNDGPVMTCLGSMGFGNIASFFIFTRMPVMFFSSLTLGVIASPSRVAVRNRPTWYSPGEL